MIGLEIAVGIMLLCAGAGLILTVWLLETIPEDPPSMPERADEKFFDIGDDE